MSCGWRGGEKQIPHTTRKVRERVRDDRCEEKSRSLGFARDDKLKSDLEWQQL